MNAFPRFLFPIALFFSLFCSPEKAEIPKNPYASWAMNPAWATFSLGTEDWEKRILPLRKEWKDALNELNRIDGIDLLVSEAAPPSWLGVPMLRRFPPAIHSLFQKHLNGIVFVNNLGSTGVSVLLRDPKGNPTGGLVFLDVSYLEKPVNDWATLKEKTAFQFSQNEDLVMTLAEERENTKIRTYEFILLHEFGHIYSVMLGVVPDFSVQTRDFSRFAFYEDIWDSELDSPFDRTILPERKKLKFYGKPELPLFPEGFHFYKKLKNTPFVTLYSAGNADDTFAEAFASYVHCILMRRPYLVEIKKAGKTILSFKNGIEEESGRRPREFLARTLGL